MNSPNGTVKDPICAILILAYKPGENIYLILKEKYQMNVHQSQMKQNTAALVDLAYCSKLISSDTNS